jgi:hypothetical protein
VGVGGAAAAAAAVLVVVVVIGAVAFSFSEKTFLYSSFLFKTFGPNNSSDFI